MRIYPKTGRKDKFIIGRALATSSPASPLLVLDVISYSRRMSCPRLAEMAHQLPRLSLAREALRDSLNLGS